MRSKKQSRWLPKLAGWCCLERRPAGRAGPPIEGAEIDTRKLRAQVPDAEMRLLPQRREAALQLGMLGEPWVRGAREKVGIPLWRGCNSRRWSPSSGHSSAMARSIRFLCRSATLGGKPRLD